MKFIYPTLAIVLTLAVLLVLWRYEVRRDHYTDSCLLSKVDFYQCEVWFRHGFTPGR